ECEGLFCETDVDECSTSPCRNGASCVNQIGTFYCICPRGYKGATCEERVEVCSSGNIPELCAGCASKAGNGRCDKECDRRECGYDGGDCANKDMNPFKACTYARYCSQVFRDGVCDEICNTEKCLFDGFDCLPKAPKCQSSCEAKKHNDVCDEECNREECEFDGGDCEMTTKIEISANLGNSAYLTEKEGVLVWIKVDVSKCVDECFDDVEVVASFIEADRDKLKEAMNMSIYSAVAKRPKGRHGSFEATLLFVVSCVSVMVLIAILFIVQQRGSRKRKVVENAPVWMPPTEFESETARDYEKEKNRHNIIAFDNAKRRRLDPAEAKLLEEKLTPNLP
ncbi:notch domain protein, partial [Teladorsagia circumcincta]